MTDTIGIVLAAGAGRRMGGPKALIGPLAEGGRTPLARVCAWVHDGGCEQVIAVIGAQADAVRAALANDPTWSAEAGAGGPTTEHAGARSSHGTAKTDPNGPHTALPCEVIAPTQDWLTVVEAGNWTEGMGASLRTGLAAADNTDAPVALITLVDLPDVREAVYARVLGVARPRLGSDTLARASYRGMPGHPVLIGRDHWSSVIASARGDQGARALFATTPHDLIECGDLASGLDSDIP